jgi:hypothetical protein
MRRQATEPAAGILRDFGPTEGGIEHPFAKKKALSPGPLIRAGDQIRTGDPHLGKVMLYH